MRTTYWSNSKLANAIRGNKKPFALSLEDWDTWKNESKQQLGIRYWIAEEGLDILQDVIMYIPDKINDVRYYLNNRFTTQTHALVSNLPKGQYQDLDTRILHCLFDELVNFVEIEKAHMMACCNDDAKLKYALPWYHKKWYTRWFIQWRCDEAGLEYLNWESSLTYNEDWYKDKPFYNKPTIQAEAAIKIKELYLWWKTIRPNRIDPYDASGYNTLYSDDRIGSPITAEKRQVFDNLRIIEQQYDDEDTAMLIELIKIRKSLWT